MPWHIGIDEAGYGPNLGPLLQSAVGTRFDAETVDFWQLLRKAVRKHGKGKTRRLVVDDSKKVYGSLHNLQALETGVLAILLEPSDLLPMPLNHFLKRIAPEALAELRGEPWFVDGQLLPVVAAPKKVAQAAARFRSVREAAGCAPFWARSRVTPPALFNALLAERDNKAEVLAHGLRWLIREARQPNGDCTAVAFAIDRQGGRLYYTSLLEAACPDGRVEIIEETELKCRYRMQSPQDLCWSIEVAADSRHFTVALASMLSKYVREVLMGQFNRFWNNHIPGLKPTAGYPGDAARFYAEIQPVMASLQIDERLVWRRK